MYLKSVSGKILFESRFFTVKDAVQEAVEKGINLNNINLRKANLTKIKLHGAQMEGACLWGAQVNEGRLINCSLTRVDFRICHLNGVNFSQTSLDYEDFRGARLKDMVINSASLSHCLFSDPAFFDLNFYNVRCLNKTIFSINGDSDLDVEKFLNQKINVG